MTPGKRELPSTARYGSSAQPSSDHYLRKEVHRGQQVAVFKPEERFLPRADSRNEAGGRAYQLPPKHALAQLAATGCFNGIYYAEAEEQLATLKTLVDQVDDNVFLAKLAVYSRQRAMMKDMPVALLLVLSKRDPALFRQVFDRVVDNGRVLRTLVQMIRSGQFGRKSLSYVAPAGLPAVAEHGVGREAAVGLDRQRSEPAGRAAPGAADPAGQRPPGTVRLADRQAGREVGTGHRGRSAGGGSGLAPSARRRRLRTRC